MRYLLLICLKEEKSGAGKFANNNMGRTSYMEAYRLTNTSRKTFSEVAQHFGGVEW